MTRNGGRNDDNNDGYMFTISVAKVVNNQVRGQISKRVQEENKALQIFRKMNYFLPPDTYTSNISYPLIRTRKFAYQRGK